MIKYIFAQESVYLQGILNDINEQDTSFLNCKHKHMMKRGAPPDKFVFLYRIPLKEGMGAFKYLNKSRNPKCQNFGEMNWFVSFVASCYN